MAIYQTQNQWGGPSAPWHAGGTWVLGGRDNQKIVEIDISSGDGGKTLIGTITYEGEEPIGLKASQITGNSYIVENQWGGSSASWHPGGNFIIGGKSGQNVVQLKVKTMTTKNGDLEGTMTYAGEGPIEFKGIETHGYSYTIKNQWGGTSAPWYEGGTFVLGTRDDQKLIALDITSSDGGKTFRGTMNYANERAIGFRAVQTGVNCYSCENHWGESSAPWHPGGNLVIGTRVNQNVVQLKIISKDNGEHFTGEMTYLSEGPIGVKAILSTNILVDSVSEEI